ALARDVVEQVDAHLAAVPRLHELSNGELLSVLDNGRTALRALHGYEALAGMLVPADGEPVTAAALALTAVAEARAEGVGPDELVARDPAVLALAPPRVGADAAVQPGPVDTLDRRSARWPRRGPRASTSTSWSPATRSCWRWHHPASAPTSPSSSGRSTPSTWGTAPRRSSRWPSRPTRPRSSGRPSASAPAGCRS